VEFPPEIMSHHRSVLIIDDYLRQTAAEIKIYVQSQQNTRKGKHTKM